MKGENVTPTSDRRLYRETHGTFEAYCRERWGMSRQRAHQLSEASKVVGALSTTVDVVPDSEAVARPLTKRETLNMVRVGCRKSLAGREMGEGGLKDANLQFCDRHVSVLFIRASVKVFDPRARGPR